MPEEISFLGESLFNYDFPVQNPRTLVREDVSLLNEKVVSPLCRTIVLRIGKQPFEKVLFGASFILGWYILLFWLIDPRFTEGISWWFSLCASFMLIVHMLVLQISHLSMPPNVSYVYVLFHTLETLSLMHIVILTASVVRAGPWFAMVAFFGCALFLFNSHWSSKFRESLLFSRWAGPSDMHVMAAFICFTNAVFPEMWSSPIVGSVSMGQILIMIALASSIVLTVFSVRHMILKQIEPALVRNAMLEWVPFATIGLGALLWQLLVRDSFLSHPHPFMIGLIFIFTYVISRMIINHTFGQPQQIIYPIALVPVGMVLLEAVGLHDSVTMIYALLPVSIVNLIAQMFVVYNIWKKKE